VFTARYALSPYITQIRFVFKGFRCPVLQAKPLILQLRMPIVVGSVLGPAVQCAHLLQGVHSVLQFQMPVFTGSFHGPAFQDAHRYGEKK
jgi:hypothetical protein